MLSSLLPPLLFVDLGASPGMLPIENLRVARRVGCQARARAVTTGSTWAMAALARCFSCSTAQRGLGRSTALSDRVDRTV